MALDFKKVLIVGFSIIIVGSVLFIFAVRWDRQTNHIIGPGRFSDPTLKSVSILCRHGNRGPMFKYNTDPYKNIFPEGLMGLTKKGKQNMYKKGQILRRLYNGFLSDLYLESEILIKTTNTSRTFMTAAMVLAGIYPPKDYQKWSDSETVWQPIPIHNDSPDRGIPRKKITVIIEQGTLQGIQYKTQASNKPYVSFLGVPYAKPPVGDLRFKPPVKHPGWSGILKAFSVGNMCMQYSFLKNKIAGSEDCLYLNIFVPQEQLEEKKAVMVFIHGGAFNNGSASPDFYSPDYLIDENVIIVTINYRLNALGFLNFDIDECPGNMGLKDQLLAIKWVKANISAFGGDDQNITIFGESAGSASVHCHTLSPQSTGLFQKAIMQSGCIFNPWAFNENHRESAFKLAKRLGCEKDNPKEVVQYLLNVPAIDIVKFTKIKGNTDFTNYEFIPSVESEAVSDRFLPAHPKILVKTASSLPVITGINNMEGMIAFGEDRMRKILNDTEEIYGLLESHYSKEIINKVKNFYFNECNLECGTTRLENICHLYSDIYFSKDFHRGYNHIITQNISPVFSYEFTFDGEINVCKNILFFLRPTFHSLKGACHADEMGYLFYGRLLGFAPKANSPELKMCRMLSKLWTNFAKTGNPNSQDLSFEWNNTSAEEPKYLLLDGDNTHMVNGLLNSSRVHFWEKISETV